MENNENKSLCAKATLIEKAMNSFKTKNAQYILYNKDDKNISMFEVTKPPTYFDSSVTTNPENQVTSDSIKNESIAYYKLDVVDGGNGGVCVEDTGDEGPTEIGKYVVIKEDNTPMIVTIAQTNGDMMTADNEKVDPANGNKYYKIQGEAGKVTADAAVEIGKVTAVVPAAEPENGEAGKVTAVVPAADPENGEAGKVTAVVPAADPENGQGGEGGARKKKRRNPTKKGRKSGKKGRKSGKKSRKARRSRRSKK
jgi:hypothetical protein